MAGRHEVARASKKRSRRQVETSGFVAMLIRIIYAYGYRISQDPAALAHLRDIQAALTDAVNLGIYGANKLGDRPYGINELGGIMGVSKQAMHQRSRLGEAVYVRLEEVRSSGALVTLSTIRDQRATALAEAGVSDRTGSVKEIAAGQ